MEIVRYPHRKPLDRKTSITIGNFDGVHMGHQALIRQTTKHAQEHRNLAAVVSMQPLPLQHFKGHDAVELLTPFRLKHRMLYELGVDVFCNLNFNSYLMNMQAHRFFYDVLLRGLNAEYIVVGDDFKFGANREGDFEMLKTMAHHHGIEVYKVPSVRANDQRISSTLIRRLLRSGDFVQAKVLLGRDFNLLGRVAHGQKLGRDLGYPTINLELKTGDFPLHGIYVVGIIIGGHKYQAVASVGLNPSVGGNAKRVEVYVLDFEQQVYGQCVEVLFYQKLRNEVEFDTLCDLTAAIERDVSDTRKYFADLEGEPV